MPLRIIAAAILGVILPNSAFADARIVIDLLDPSDGGPQPLAGLLIIDFLIDVDAGDSWLTTELSVSAVGDSRLVYNQTDPNHPDLTDPGSGNSFVTSVTTPMPRFGPGRFDQGFAAVIGSDCPFGSGILASPELLSVAWYDERVGRCTDRPTTNGAIARVAVELDPQLLCGGDANCCYATYPANDVPEEARPILEASCARPGNPPFGVAWSTCRNPQLVFHAWVLALTPVAGSCRFDFNRDRAIDVADLSMVLSAFGATPADPAYDPALDIDDNQLIDLQDMATFLAHWGAF